MRKSDTRFISSFHHTPIEGYRHLFHSVLRGGHYRISADYPMESWSRPGHDVLLSVTGSGSVRIANRSFTIGPGQIGWIDCQHRSVHWPDRSEPWEFLWIRLDSAQLDPITAALHVDHNPIFTPRKTADAVTVFKSIHRLLRTRPINMDAALHAGVGALVAVLFEARQSAASGTQHELAAGSMPGLAAVLNAMRVDYRRRWTVEHLAQIAGISAPQFFRRFHQATGSSPINWLRRERINEAKRRLGETHDRIRDIAEHVGYGDALYFSRDFSKLAGVSPRQYRKREQAPLTLFKP